MKSAAGWLSRRYVCLHNSRKIYISKKWGFTKWDREDFEGMRASGRLVTDGVGVQYKPEHGPLSEWCRIQAAWLEFEYHDTPLWRFWIYDWEWTIDVSNNNFLSSSLPCFFLG
ncbi:hypothetical protein TCAL_17332 [Tigriopus californicus]|uniref:Uncharacterized protein n=1 Tax=Tigriopus californicus TaxID=6832 RepID=A0A553NYF7_TIGCA|nr:hypothetical protein TCAL_17332 [Tigriopus californicus]